MTTMEYRRIYHWTGVNLRLTCKLPPGELGSRLGL